MQRRPERSRVNVSSRGSGEAAECGAIGDRWVCVKPPGHAGLHAYELRKHIAPRAAGPKGDGE